MPLYGRHERVHERGLTEETRGIGQGECPVSSWVYQEVPQIEGECIRMFFTSTFLASTCENALFEGGELRNLYQHLVISWTFRHFEMNQEMR